MQFEKIQIQNVPAVGWRGRVKISFVFAFFGVCAKHALPTDWPMPRVYTIYSNRHAKMAFCKIQSIGASQETIERPNSN